jgi:very-long-chain ceramide synthase
MKGYMLAQLAFWVQQVLVINIEERRKDYWQMLTHHFVTISLMYGSYRYGYTRVGNLILVLMDVVDIFLPVRIWINQFPVRANWSPRLPSA